MRIGERDHDVLVPAPSGRSQTPASVPPEPTDADEAVDLAVGLRARFPAPWSRCAPGGWRRCRTGWPRSRRSARSCAAARRAGPTASRSCSGWRRARPALRSVRRRNSRSMSFFSWLWVFGNDDDGAESQRVGDQREPDAGIAGGAFDDGAARPQLAALDSASRMMNSAARSFTDWPGFMNSALPRMLQPVSSEARFSLISGVLPIASTTSVIECSCARNLAGPLPNAGQTLVAAEGRKVKAGLHAICASGLFCLGEHHLADVDIARQESGLAIGQVIFPQPPEPVVETRGIRFGQAARKLLRQIASVLA